MYTENKIALKIALFPLEARGNNGGSSKLL
jgi:hypothetical protein